MDEGDNTLAHRIAHNLKSIAGQIGEEELQQAAAHVEQLLKEGENDRIPDLAPILEAEVNKVIRSLTPALDEDGDKGINLDKEQALSLFKDLEHMLRNRNPECYHLLPLLRAIPGSDTLAELVEEYDFVEAIASLDELRRNWSGKHG
ncbi:MAG: Hpt domain-containing protein [Clostridiales bacterium]|nr:Hpt domain-containing protein [Clostridiales bacterium]